MINFKRYIFIFLLLVCFFSISDFTYGDELKPGYIISPKGTFYSLKEAIKYSENGDVINVYGGQYYGGFSIDKSLTLIGHEWPILDGNNSGTVLTILAPNTSIKGFSIRNSGHVLNEENSGIAVESKYVTIDGNQFDEILFGIYLRKASNSTIINNIINSKNLALPRRGDPIRIWYSDDVIVENNKIYGGRDLILWYSNRLYIRKNEISEGRYGLHFMYCDNALVQSNQLLNNSVGAFLMYSRNLNFSHNFISNNRGPSGFGIGLKDVDDALIENNIFSNNRIGASLDNSPREIDSTMLFKGNMFAFNDIGVKFMPSVKRNNFSSNTFKENQEQINISGRGQLQEIVWTINGIGNYWSDYAGYDENNDQIGDIPYKSQKLFENLTKKYPSFKIYIYSPLTRAIDFAAKAIPYVRPQPKLIDFAPLMKEYVPEGIRMPPVHASISFGILSFGIFSIGLTMIFIPYIFVRKFRIPYDKEYFFDDSINPILSINQLSKKFNNKNINNNLNFNITKGESIAIWGSNGAGKTTLINCIMGLNHYEGTIKLIEYDIKKNGKEARNLIGYVPQELNLHEDLTVIETMNFYSQLKRVNSEIIKKELQRIGLENHIYKTISELSGGMKQKLSLAISLLSDPPILILDEPTANLDISSRISFSSLIKELKNEGKTIIFASHRIDDILKLADRVLILNNGNLVKECLPEQLEEFIEEKLVLSIYVSHSQISEAFQILVNKGFNVNINDDCILVKTTMSEKIESILCLNQAHIKIDNFELDMYVENNRNGI